MQRHSDKQNKSYNATNEGKKKIKAKTELLSKWWTYCNQYSNNKTQSVASE
jgi:hypothetical protein